MEKIDYITLNEVELETISGGDDCFIGDIGCIGWGLLKSIGGMIKTAPYVPPVCIPKSSWNPAPPVPC
ncbi:hypothetical protein [Streptococcus pneumoniae]|uniref:hypothetical protein n=1 Tax=Streptococcus pneumoniae TaxID=1313 RepID=UPI000618F31F|nr:hypothetical protein [Streptococcus pneumoniae]CRG79826.1 Uncharacterised protein [Streptococcus pneumoniae]SNG63974.1 Uncharacterised protein [Streptococcus pneumoniae]